MISGGFREQEFALTNGTIVKRKVSECYISLPQGECHTLVVLGEADDKALLGVVTLEILGLVLNPFKPPFNRCAHTNLEVKYCFLSDNCEIRQKNKKDRLIPQ